MRLAAILSIALLALAACTDGEGPDVEAATPEQVDGTTAPEGAPPEPGGISPLQGGEAPALDTPADPIAEAEAEPPPPLPAFLAAARDACIADGGIFSRAPGGSGAMLCFRRPDDANQRCTSARDCEGACLARSGTCAPIIPLLGCNEVLLSNGARTEQCIQ